MCCAGFWKRIVTLCLTFWLGVFVSYLFAYKDLPVIEPVYVVWRNDAPTEKMTEANLSSERENCEPVDKDLKYVYPGSNKKESENNVEKIKTPPRIRPETKAREELEKEFNPWKHGVQYDILLHRENCDESKWKNLKLGN
jgi:hypothetical protein